MTRVAQHASSCVRRIRNFEKAFLEKSAINFVNGVCFRFPVLAAPRFVEPGPLSLCVGQSNELCTRD